MSDFLRGIVKKATFEIEYPDGSRKTAELAEPQSVGLIAFASENIPAPDLPRFDVSELDWEQNPAMMIYPRSPKFEGILSGGGEGGIPFCTHNGCA